MHWGGGTLTFLDQPQITMLMETLKTNFRFSNDQESEYSIELDPREVDPADIQFLRSLGFNRVSLGVQDLDPKVQRAVNRVQPLEKTRDM